ncbi:hypothetical protein JXA40_05705 [bacterium]|nr:hypothetical protein [candidate division CSSED10-310 bacterium]
MEKTSDPQSKQTWENGYGGHSKAQLLRLSRLSFDEKLKWLDAMQRFLAGSNPVKPDL